MPQVTVLPSNTVFEVQPDETLLSAAMRHGLTWPTVCGGEGQCRTCYVTLEEGEANLSPVGSTEEEALEALAIVAKRSGKPVRLACQVMLDGNIVVHRTGVRAKDAG